MASDDIDSFIVDLADWFSRAAEDFDPRAMLKDFARGVKPTCQACGLDFTRLATENILGVQFFLPVTDIAAYFPIEKLGDVIDLVNTSPGGEIGAKLGKHKKLGECVVIERYYRIPTSLRDGFVISDMIPERDAILFHAILDAARMEPKQSGNQPSG